MPTYPYLARRKRMTAKGVGNYYCVLKNFRQLVKCSSLALNILANRGKAYKQSQQEAKKARQ